VVSTCECGNDSPGCIRCGGYLDLLVSEEGFCSMELVILCMKLTAHFHLHSY